MEEQLDYFPWSTASTHNTFFSSQVSRHLWPSPFGMCVQHGACPTYLPTCVLEHGDLCLPSPTQRSPSPQSSSACGFSCHCFWKSPSGASEDPGTGSSHYCWVTVTARLCLPSSHLHRPQDTKLNCTAT